MSDNSVNIPVKKFLVFFVIMLFFTSAAAWMHRDTNSRGNLRRIMRNGELKVITRNSNTTFYYDKDGKTGFEYDMVSDFCRWLGVKADFVVNNSISGILQDIRYGRGDIAAAGLTRTDQREKLLRFGPDYFTTRQVLVVHKDNAYIDSPEEMVGKTILIPAGASYEETLRNLKRAYPDLTWDVSEDLSAEQMIEEVAQKRYTCTILDDNIFRINQRYYPDIRATADLSAQNSFAWIMGREGDELEKKVREWFVYYQESGRYDQLVNKYYGHTDNFDYVDVRTFHKKVSSVLPGYEPIFKEAADATGMDWSLLAALSYQESHWKKYACSPTGVRGIMMLTRSTAAEMGVNNRLDVKSSVFAGARYLKQLIDRVPDSVNKDDRIYFALAAYNIGMGHLNDARQLAGDLGVDSDSWLDLKTVLPLLSQRKFYMKLKYGYARGSEPIDYVSRILNYKEILDNLNGEIP